MIEKRIVPLAKFENGNRTWAAEHEKNRQKRSGQKTQKINREQ